MSLFNRLTSSSSAVALAPLICRTVRFGGRCAQDLLVEFHPTDHNQRYWDRHNVIIVLPTSEKAAFLRPFWCQTPIIIHNGGVAEILAWNTRISNRPIVID